jgi:protein SCO1/2
MSFVAALLLAIGCHRSPTPSPHAPTQTFHVNGVVKDVQNGGKTVSIRHQEITNYMPAMTMPFDVKDVKESKGLRPGDAVSFRLNVTDNDSWIDQIRVLDATPPFTNAPPGVAQPVSNLDTYISSPSAALRVVQPLAVGDPLPDYQFTNQLAQPIRTTQFKGQALAITFVFTRCPLPNFCPRMSSNFADAQKKLLTTPNAPTNWHLLTITFDPEFDTPKILKAYATRFEADPKHWSFLTGDTADITAIAQQFGETFWTEQGSINHNLRTIIISSSGRIQNIITGNNWSADDLVEELTKASR